MEKLNKIFNEKQILESEEMNQIVTKIDEIVESSNTKDEKLTELEQKIGVISSELDDINGEEV